MIRRKPVRIELQPADIDEFNAHMKATGRATLREREPLTVAQRIGLAKK